MKNLLKDLLIFGGLAVLLTGCAGLECSNDSDTLLGNYFRYVNYSDGGTTHQSFLGPNLTPESNVGFAAFSGVQRAGGTTVDVEVVATGPSTPLTTRSITPGSLGNVYFGITYGDQANIRMCFVKAGAMTNGNGGMVVANLDRIRGTIDYRIERPTDGFVVHQVTNLTVGADLLTQPAQAHVGLTPGAWRVVATQPGTANVVWTANVTVRVNEFTMVLPFDGAGASQNPVAFQVPAF